MNQTLLILAIVVATALIIWICLAFLKPFVEVRSALARLAKGQPVRIPALKGLPVLRAMGRELMQIGERSLQIERDAEVERSNLRAILSSMREGVLIVNRDFRVELANEALMRMFDFQVPPVGRSVMEVFQDHTLREAIGAAFEMQGGESEFLAVEQLDGPAPLKRHFEVNATLLKRSLPESGGTGVLAVFHDITEMKTHEILRRELTANVSHELRTPLSIIRGNIETLLDGAIDDRPTTLRFLEAMDKNGKRLSALLEDLLDISRLEEGTASLDVENVNLREVADAVVERVRPEMERIGTGLKLDFPNDLPRIEGDPHRIDQIFFNLIENALKHTVESKEDIEVRAEALNGSVRIAVHDSGPGIPYEDQHQIFDRFYRVHKDRSRDAGGTGLGLSIVKGVVEAHHGNVGVESVPGEGATFLVTLPIRQPG